MWRFGKRFAIVRPQAVLAHTSSVIFSIEQLERRKSVSSSINPPPSELKVYHASLISICMQTDAAQHRNKNILPSAIIGLPKKQRRPTEPKKDPRPPFVLKYPIINLPSQPGGKKRSVAPLRHYERVLNPTNTALSSSLLSPPLSSDYCARDS